MTAIIKLSELLLSLPKTDRRETDLVEGGHVFRQGDAAFGPGLVKQGRVEMRRHTPAGVAVPLFKTQAPSTFAEASIFSDCYHCDCVAGPSSVRT